MVPIQVVSRIPAMPFSPPCAKTESHIRSVHGDLVEDPYYWMADKTNPEFRAYLEAENDFTVAVTSHLAELRESIFEDISDRTKQTDLTVPDFVTHTDGSSWWYFARTTQGLNYPSYCRLPAESRDALPDITESHPNEQVILDLNAEAAGHEFAALGWAEVSPGGSMLAYSIDTTGDERFDIWIRDLNTETTLEGPIPGVGSGGTWLTDEWIFYNRIDSSWRPFQVWRHTVGSEEDHLVLQEDDESFWLGLSGSRDREWAIIDLSSKTSSETHLIPARDRTSTPRCVAPRRPDIEYSVEVARDCLYILHNDEAPQFELARAPLDSTTPEQWITVIKERPQTRLLDVDAYDRWLVLQHRTDGLTGVTVLPLSDTEELGSQPRPIEFPHPLYEVFAGADADPATDRIRLSYQSLTSPAEVIEYRLDTSKRKLLRRQPVLDHRVHGPFDSDDYVSERVWAEADDGSAVPISIVRHKSTPVDGTAPCLVYGYGSYEISVPLSFSIPRLSLLDRGFVFAIAHVRGGGEMGRPWYDGGRLGNKMNSFTDFIACGRRLVTDGYAHPDKLLAEGGSAGGLLIGAVVNMAPDLFRAVHAAVPFVDNLTTILNPELPLTITEWEEWGDPLHDSETYAYVKSYSPYENVPAQQYPSILATTSFNDTRVEVTEPAKWVARLRATATNTDQRTILLRTDLSAGHGGASGRYGVWRDRAFELAWLIDQTR